MTASLPPPWSSLVAKLVHPVAATATALPPPPTPFCKHTHTHTHTHIHIETCKHTFKTSKTDLLHIIADRQVHSLADAVAAAARMSEDVRRRFSAFSTGTVRLR